MKTIRLQSIMTRTLIVLVLAASTVALNDTCVSLLLFGRPRMRLDFLTVLGNARSSALSLGLSAKRVCRSSMSVSFSVLDSISLPRERFKRFSNTFAWSKDMLGIDPSVFSRIALARHSGSNGHVRQSGLKCHFTLLRGRDRILGSR